MKTHKVLFAAIFLFLFSSFSFSQDALKKGVYNLSGSISYSNSKEDFSGGSSKQFAFSIAPGINYFVIDNLLIGTDVSFFYNESKYSSGSFNSFDVFRQFGIGPDIRYYFPGDNIFPFIGISATYIKVINSELEGKSFTATAGINYFLSRSAALEPFLAYSIASYSSDNDSNTFSLGIRMSYFIVN